MELKGKEFDIGGLRIQVDPLVIGRRIIMHRIRMLVAIAAVGGVATVLYYLSRPKIFESRSTIVVRTEALGEHYVQHLLNTTMREVASNEELMLIINELNLYPGTRASMPYEMALKYLQRELALDRESGSVGIRFESTRPKEAQRVVAFVTERVLSSVAGLLDSPYARSLEALDRGLRELSPKVADAQQRLFEFQAAHPEIVIRVPETAAGIGSSPLRDVEAQIRAAESDMKRCFSSADEPEPTPSRPQRVGPQCQALRNLQRERDGLLQQYTENHPAVTRKTSEIQAQGELCQTEREKDQNREAERGVRKPSMTPDQCRMLVAERIQRLHVRKADLEKTSIRKPGLQSEWARLSAEASQLESQQRAMLERRARTVQDRLLAANSFQENFQLVDPPRVPGLPSKPNRNQLMVMGMLLTAALGIGLAALLEAFRQTFSHPSEVEEQTGLAVLTELPPVRTRR
ncbi:MAG: hypothetical protein H6729_06655 [Deltaproteobacteria bacterium]|nr:hypothetical protein [Deltaproteobacteria bacterium]